MILSSPFEAFNRYEADHGLPRDFIRAINATNPTQNAWARLERSDISPVEFDAEFAAESASCGHRVSGSEVLALLSGDIRPEMVDLLDRVKAAGYRVACLTNNVTTSDSEQDGNSEHDGDSEHDGNSERDGDSHPTSRSAALREIMARFDVVVESSKVGVRKPEVRFYEIACDLINVAPHECVFLDDLGINLKPAAAMGMRTIKVLSAAQAIAELTALLLLD